MIHFEKYRSEYSMSVAVVCDVTHSFAAVGFYDLQLDRIIARSVIVREELTDENVAAALAKLVFMSMREYNIPAAAVQKIGCSAEFDLAYALEEGIDPTDMFLRPDTEIMVLPFVSMHADGRFTAMLAAVPFKKGTFAVQLGATLNLAYHDGEKLKTASVKLTGAFDSSALEDGMPCEYGAIDELRREDDRKLSYCVVGDGDACGVAPSALLDGVCIMKNEGIIDEDGVMTDRDMFYIGEDFVIKQCDVRALQSDKANTIAAIQCFLSKCDKVEQTYLSGDVLSRNGRLRLKELGIIPAALAEEADTCRSYNEQGVYNCLKNKESYDSLMLLIRNADDISNDIYDGFDDLYIANLGF